MSKITLSDQILALAKHCEREGLPFPANSAIADAFKLPENKIRTGINRMLCEGILYVVKIPNRPQSRILRIA